MGSRCSPSDHPQYSVLSPIPSQTLPHPCSSGPIPLIDQLGTCLLLHWKDSSGPKRPFFLGIQIPHNLQVVSWSHHMDGPLCSEVKQNPTLGVSAQLSPHKDSDLATLPPPSAPLSNSHTVNSPQPLRLTPNSLLPPPHLPLPFNPSSHLPPRLSHPQLYLRNFFHQDH